MKRTIYEVHSDVNENNIYCEFYGKGSKQRALAYAKEHIDELTWVDKVLYDDRLEDYQYLGGIWSYDEDENCGEYLANYQIA